MQNLQNPKISIIIRCHNESKWINLCLKKINNQTIKPFEVLILDNNSTDGTSDLTKRKGGVIKYIYYPDNYIPGKMLNYGFSKCKGEFILVISAHCIPYDDYLIENLLNPLVKNKNICASYSRQIPLKFSDAITVRDLMLTYGPENKLQKSDPQFNNACSLIRKTEWKKTKFDNKMTNLEDRYWGSKKIKQKKFIYYSANAKVFHYHGSHHNNNTERLQNTKNTIFNKKNSFYISDENLGFNKKDILPIYIHGGANRKKLIKNLQILSKKFNEKIIVFKKNINLKKNNKYILFNRLKNETKNEKLYLSDVLDYYKKQILRHSKNKEYLLICSDNFVNISNSYLNRVVKLVNDYFPDTIFAASKTLEPIFSNNSGNITKLNTLANSRKENKPLLMAKRNCGIVVHISNLFKADKFGGVIKIVGDN